MQSLAKVGIDFIGHHFGEIMTGIAIVGCMTPFGLGVCIALNGAALGARIYQRYLYDHVGLFSRTNGMDVLLTTASLGLLAIPFSKAQPIIDQMPVAFRAFIKVKAAAGDVLNLLCGMKSKSCP